MPAPHATSDRAPATVAMSAPAAPARIVRERTRLAAADWLAAAGLALVVLGGAWQFSLSVSNELAALRATLAAMNGRLDQVNARLDRIEDGPRTSRR
jgi:acyl carrier protein phosphodiesterase